MFQIYENYRLRKSWWVIYYATYLQAKTLIQRLSDPPTRKEATNSRFALNGLTEEWINSMGKI